MEQAPNDGAQPDVLSVCENGFGKRTEFSEYKRQHRGGMGVITIKTSARNGKVVGIKLVDESKDLMIITEKGMTIRLRCGDIRSVGRNAQGVTLARMEEGDKIARIAPVVKAEEEEAEEPAK
jgi:DNA gyrase subunit A